MERGKIINISPVCRFGPGGDYSSVWPSEWADLVRQPKGLLAGLLNVLAGLTQELRGGPEEITIEGPVEIDESCGQPCLFADDLTANKAAENRSVHRIRTYKPLARKKPCFSAPVQPTLFDADLKNAKTA